MPSVDPQRLEREIERVLSDPTEPRIVKDGLRDLFEFYGGHPRHAPARTRLEDPTRSYGVPTFVVEQVAAHLIEIPLPEELRAALIDELWSTGYSEQRRVAIELVKAGDPGDARRKALQIAGDKSSTPQLKLLAKAAIDPIRESEPELHWETVQDLIREGSGNQRLLGLYALEAACREPDFEILPVIFQCLEGIGAECHGVEARAFASLLDTIAARYLLEVVRFLEDEAGRHPLDRHTQGLLDKFRDGLALESRARRM